MISIHLVAVFAALIAYAAAARLGTAKRTVIALLVFLIPTVAAWWGFMNMDKPPPDAVNVHFEDAAQ